MRTTVTVALTAAATLPLMIGAAGTASAAPGDIDASFTAAANPLGGSTVTGTFTAAPGAPYPGYCQFSDPNATTGDPTFPLALSGSASPTSGPYITGADLYVPDGTYIIEWVCYTTNFDTLDATTGLGGTAQPTTLVVIAAEEPDTPGPECTGSVCLPTGTFGF